MWMILNWLLYTYWLQIKEGHHRRGGCCGSDRMVVGFTTTYIFVSNVSNGRLTTDWLIENMNSDQIYNKHLHVLLNRFLWWQPYWIFDNQKNYQICKLTVQCSFIYGLNSIIFIVSKKTILVIFPLSSVLNFVLQWCLFEGV
jgi:hypothetical protein